MSELVLIAPRIEINGVDRSTYIKKVSLPIEVDQQESTSFGSGGWRTRLGGLKDGSLGLTMNNDFAAGAIDSVMWALLGTVVTFKVRPTTAAVGTSNPEYQGSILVTGWTPFDTEVGGLVEVSVDFPLTGIVTRATS